VNLQRRLERLENLAADLKLVNKPDVLMCKDMAWDELIERVNAALCPDADDLIEQIEAFAREAQATPLFDHIGRKEPQPVLDEEGKQVFDHHFSQDWMWGLVAGSWSLPKSLPRSFLEGFCSRYGMVMWRCVNCLCGLGNNSRCPNCPICGSTELTHKYLAGPP
jgi:hypothetical protein